ncbi:hypothetical protein [Ruminococcus sp.]|uniref:hypothetical protein n=1 Tax=Ruminococcus sp. TaxID=41978 RepID=UPI001B4EDFF2|nr:hypothetical protein [Ruminococcus sp.]MBP5431951.1 hypothetical protein [Ruminococcus sp.]
MADEKKGITVRIDADLHAEIREYIESKGMTMAEFVSQALYNELHPKIQPQEVKNMGPMRTMAFQMPEDMFQRLKDYLHEHNMTQKEFVLGLVEAELNRDQELKNAQKAVADEAVSDEKAEIIGEELEDIEELDDDESEDEDFDEDMDDIEEPDEDEELDDEESEDEDFDEDMDDTEEADEDEEHDETESLEDSGEAEENDELSEDEAEDEELSMAM